MGGKNLVPMKELVSALEKGNYHSIKTYIQSGNVVLQDRRRPVDIGFIVRDRFGFEPEILVFEEPEFRETIEKNPYKSPDGKNVHFFFCKNEPKINTERLEKYKSDTEEYHVDGKVFYLYAPDGIGRSKLAANLESCLGVPATGRNLNTVNKLRQMVQNM